MDRSTFLPHLAGLHIERVLVTDDPVTFTGAADGDAAPCPCCGAAPNRVRSRYLRTMADRPWGHRSVTIIARVRRFACRTTACPQHIFAERLPALVAPSARRTVPHQAELRDLGLALGDRAGTRLAARSGIAISHDTVLRLAAAPLPAVAVPRVVGIDDFAFRRGRRFGTLVVGLERHRPSDGLPDRTTDTVARWLASRPSIEVVVRDRHDAYAAAAAQGVPHARQVVDRFHIVQNLGEAVEHFLLTQPACLCQVTLDDDGQANQATGPAPTPPPAIPALPPVATAASSGQQRPANSGRRSASSSIMRSIGYGTAASTWPPWPARSASAARPSTATYACPSRRYLRLPEPPLPKRPTGRRPRSALAPYVAYLRQRWEEGCTNATRLWREIRAMGYPGTASPVSKLARQWRLQHQAGQRPAPLPRARQHLTARQATRLFLKRPAALTEPQRRVLDWLQETDAAIAAAYRLTQDFVSLVRERQGQRLDE